MWLPLIGAGRLVRCFRVATHHAVAIDHRRLAFRMPVLAAYRATEAAVKIGMRFLQIADDFEIDTFDLRQVDLLDMHKAQELADRLRHVAPAFIARAAALGNADLCPELLLIKAKAAPDFTRIQHSVEQFHKDPVHVVRKGIARRAPSQDRRANTIGIFL